MNEINIRCYSLSDVSCFLLRFPLIVWFTPKNIIALSEVKTPDLIERDLKESNTVDFYTHHLEDGFGEVRNQNDKKRV